MLNHGLSTGALFLLIGVLYERRHTRLIESYGGIFKTVPYYSSVFMLITLSSIALPGLNGFIGEFLIFIGSFKQYPLLTFISLTGMILSAIYMLTLYEKVFFGPIKLKENEAISDLKIREWLYLIPLIFFIVYIGLKPQPFLNIIDKSTDNYIGYINAGARK
jgi:NADH-quinone oxidoreductase subunit M